MFELRGLRYVFVFAFIGIIACAGLGLWGSWHILTWVLEIIKG